MPWPSNFSRDFKILLAEKNPKKKKQQKIHIRVMFCLVQSAGVVEYTDYIFAEG